MSFFRSFSSNSSSTTVNYPNLSGNKSKYTPTASTPPTKKSLTYILNTDTDSYANGNHSIGVNSLIYNKNDQCLISGGRDGQISVWSFDEANGDDENRTDYGYSQLKSRDDVKNFINSNLENDSEIANIEESIKEGLTSFRIRESTLRPKHLCHSELHHFGWINDLKLLDNTTTVASCSNDLSIKLWDYQNDIKHTLGTHDDYIKKIAFTNYYKNQLVSGGLDKIIKIWDVQKGEVINSHYFTEVSHSVYSLDTHNDLIIASGPSNIVTLFDRRDFTKPIKQFIGHTDNVRSLVLKDQCFLSGSSDTTVKLWDLRTTRVLRNFDIHDTPVWSLHVSPDDNDISTFYSADKTGILMKTDLRSSDLRNSAQSGYLQYKLNEQSGITTVVADVNLNHTIDEPANSSSCGINDIVEIPQLGTVWTATSSSIHNTNTNFINSWCIPDTTKFIIHQSLLLNKKIAKLYGNGENEGNGESKSIASIHDTDDLVSQLSGDDLDHIDNALFSNTPGLDNIFDDAKMANDLDGGVDYSGIREGDDDTSSLETSNLSGQSYLPATCFMGLLGNLNTQYLMYDDSIIEEKDEINQYDPFTEVDTEWVSSKTRRISINNHFIAEEEMILVPFNEKSISNIAGTSGLVKCKVLNNRRHVAAMDQSGCVYVFDILLNRMIQRVDSTLSVNSIPSVEHVWKQEQDEIIEDPDFSLSEKFEAICEKIQTQETLPPWCTAQVKSGKLFITIKENDFSNCEIYGDDFQNYYGDVMGSGNPPRRVNLGKVLVKSMFGGFVNTTLSNHNIELEPVESYSSLSSKDSTQISVIQPPPPPNHVKIPQPAPQTRNNALEKSSKRGLFGRLKGKKDNSTSSVNLNTSSNSGTSTPNSSRPSTPINTPSNIRLNKYLERIQQCQKSNELIRYLEINPDMMSYMKMQEGWDEREREDNRIPRVDYHNDKSTLVIINDEVTHESRPAFRIHLEKIVNGTLSDKETEKLLENLPVWVLKGLVFHIYPIASMPPQKIGFTVAPEEGSGLDQIDGEKLRLNSVGLLRISGIAEFIKNKLPGNDTVELTCKGHQLSPKDTLGTIRARVWRQGGDVEFIYRKQ
ncbi:hypothetical protein JL09_g2578 [Pichia kudriavzevii]|uniref:TEP-1 C-terminal beta-propeller domain-containing protein n=1 Tax=Pichia kudriavzevii TaxID=4909 RepID=A0A099P1V5_PICKU|nr:hypothetical protein JL09_g2578 [Pichia kudriavzevii]